jgi:hypothetical protein
MAVTDMTESLPWWARGGMPQSQGPVPPQGGDAQAWLRYLASFAGLGSAQAGENNPVAALNEALKNRPPGPPAPDNTIQPTLPPGPAPAPAGPPQFPTSPPPTPFSTGAFQGPAPMPMPYAATGPLSPGGPGPLGATPGGVGGFAGPAQGGGPVAAPGGPVPSSADVAAPDAQPVSAVRGPLAGGGPMNAGSRFIGIDAPNVSPQNSMRGGPQGTALNLAGLFGGGQQPAAAAPMVGKQPGMRVINGPLAQGGIASAPMPPTMPDDIRRQRAIQLAALHSGYA